MWIRYVGPAREAIGFSLAGIEVSICDSAADVTRAVSPDGANAHIVLLLLAPEAVALNPAACETALAREHAPYALVLPSPDRAREAAS